MNPFPTPEKSSLKLGFLPLMDCAPLVVAREQGFFSDNGLDVVLSREANWASIRDKVAVGLLDGAQMLAPMPLASTLGLGIQPTPMMAPMVLSLNGNAITITQPLYHDLLEQSSESHEPLAMGQALKQTIERSSEPVSLATVYPHSCHHYQLRYWLSACGIDPDRDLNLVAIPPQRMLDHLRAGDIQGFCVGEPWNSLAEIEGIGRILTSGYQIWPDAIEKVLGITQAWAERYPNSLQALIRSLIQACRWLNDPSNHSDHLSQLSLPPYLDRVASQLQQADYPLQQSNPMIRQTFYRHDANVPWHAHGFWLLEQMRQNEQWSGADAEPVVRQVFRPDIYRQAAISLGLNPPLGRHPAFTDMTKSSCVEPTFL